MYQSQELTATRQAEGADLLHLTTTTKGHQGCEERGCGERGEKGKKAMTSMFSA